MGNAADLTKMQSKFQRTTVLMAFRGKEQDADESGPILYAFRLSLPYTTQLPLRQSVSVPEHMSCAVPSFVGRWFLRSPHRKMPSLARRHSLKTDSKNCQKTTKTPPEQATCLKRIFTRAARKRAFTLAGGCQNSNTGPGRR